MTWSYTYIPTIWPSLLTVLFLLAIVLFSARRLSVPGALPFMIAVIFSAAWAAGSVMEYAAVDLQTKIFWIRFQTTWQLPAVTTVTCFVLEYFWPGRWLTRRNRIMLSIVPLLVFGLIWSDDRLHLMWHSFNLEGTLVTPLLGPGSWMAIIYSFGLVILSLAVLTWLFLHSPQHRWPVVIMVIGHIVVRTTYMLEKANLVSSTLPFDVLGLAFMAVMYAIALFGFRMLDPIPLARQMAIEQLHDGMLVLDPQGRVANLNPAAERIFRAERKHIQGMPIGQLLPMLPELSSASAIPTALTKTIEMKTVPEAGTSDYELDFFPLNDFRGLPVGHLLLLHDVTERRRSQEQILDQQRALATLTERARLGRELHDELSQDLALINLQAQLVSGLVEAGQAEQAQAQLQILEKAARGAQAGVRGEISKLSHSIAQEKDFLSTLRHFLETFQQTYDTETELAVPATQQVISFAPTVEVQLLRIVQEAFSNIRKHAGATHVRVALKRETGCIELSIEDNGVGFDPHKLSASHEAFGLGIMSQRAAEVGGRVEMNSAPGKGTKVIIVVPVNEEAR